MITDRLEYYNIYTRISDRIANALMYLLTTDLKSLEKGTYIVEEDEIFAQVSEYVTKPADELKWESHFKFVDIQVIIEGEEKIGFAPLERMRIIEPYNDEKDIQFLSGKGDYLTARPGSFTMFFPHDAHQPGIATEGFSKVKKVVLKVKV
jgi:YhcH/YjgK/YiaL family protein